MAVSTVRGAGGLRSVHAWVLGPLVDDVVENFLAVCWTEYDLLDSSEGPPVEVWPVARWNNVRLVRLTGAGLRLAEVIGSATARSQPQPADDSPAPLRDQFPATLYGTFKHFESSEKKITKLSFRRSY